MKKMLLIIVCLVALFGLTSNSFASSSFQLFTGYGIALETLDPATGYPGLKISKISTSTWKVLWSTTLVSFTATSPYLAVGGLLYPVLIDSSGNISIYAEDYINFNYYLWKLHGTNGATFWDQSWLYANGISPGSVAIDPSGDVFVVETNTTTNVSTLVKYKSTTGAVVESETLD